MNFNIRPNDWADVIQAQSYANIKSEAQERSLNNLNKQVYKSELENQFREKQIQRENERQLRELDAQLLYQKKDAFTKYEEKAKNEKKKFQEQLSLEYNSDIINKAIQKRNQADSELNQDKNMLNNIKSQFERDNLKKQLYKDEIINSELDFLQSQSKFRQEENRKREMEKKFEQEIVMKNIERVNRRDQDYRDHLEKLARENELKSKAYEKVISDSNNKEFQKAEIFSLWEKDASKKMHEKELRLLEQKLNSKREISFALQQQLFEKNQKKQQELEYFNLEKKRAEENSIRNRLFEEKTKNELTKSKDDYKKILDSQKEQKNYEKFNEKLMSPKEKNLNLGILKRIENKQDIEFTGVPGIHPRVSPLQNSFKRAHKSLAGFPDEFPGKHSRNISQELLHPNVLQSIESSRLNSVASFHIDPSKHDPIVNPLGSQHPINLNTHLLRGKGLALLN